MERRWHAARQAFVEAVAVGLPDELKGEQLWGYVVLAAGVEPTETLRAELVAIVGDQLGKSFRPAGIRFTTAVPKTRSAKVLRRAVRAVALGADLGDLSSLEDPATLDAIRNYLRGGERTTQRVREALALAISSPEFQEF